MGTKLQVSEINPIPIRFDGRDAARNVLDLNALGVSLQGASRLVGSGAQVALTGRFSKKELPNSVRVYALPPRLGSYEIWVAVTAFGGAMATALLLPVVDTALKTAATKVTEALVNSTIARWAKRPREAEEANSIAVKALEEMGHTSRAAIALAERVALANYSGTRMLVNPIGISADTVQIGRSDAGAFPVGFLEKAEIERTEPIEIGDERVMTVHLSELDLVNKSCKLSSIDNDQLPKRIPGQITDPQLLVPNNPYSSAFDRQLPLRVKCKPQYSEGELEKLYISDTIRDAA